MKVILSTTLVKGGRWCNRAINMNFWKLSCAAGQNSKWGSNMKPWWNFHFKCWYVVFVLLNTGFLVWTVYICVFPAGKRRLCEFTLVHTSSWDKRHRTRLSSTHQSNNTLTNVIDIPASAAQEGGGAAEGHFAVGGRFHLHVAVLGVLAGQRRWVSDGGVRVFAVQWAGAVAAHGAFDVVCRSRGTRTRSARTQMYDFLLNSWLWSFH